MSNDFTDEQKELLNKPVITIMPSFNQEWVVEVHSYEGDLIGRLNVVDDDTLIGAIRAAITDDSTPPRFDVN